MEFRKKHFDIHKVINKDASETLRGVHITKKGATIATNGHILLRMNPSPQEKGAKRTEIPKEGITITSGAAKETAAHALKKDRVLSLMELKGRQKKGYEVGFCDSEFLSNFVARAEAVFPPKVEKLFPSKKKMATYNRIAVNGKYLTTLLNLMMEKGGDANNYVEFWIPEDESQVTYLTTRDKSAEALIMPLRIPEERKK